MMTITIKKIEIFKINGNGDGDDCNEFLLILLMKLFDFFIHIYLLLFFLSFYLFYNYRFIGLVYWLYVLVICID
jgi:hypothetical protein